jgi:hypothetical protein
MATAQRISAELETALLRRGVTELTSAREHCARCRRTPLVGERVYAYDQGHILCELCRRREGRDPLESHLVHGPQFGRSLKITVRRVA